MSRPFAPAREFLARQGTRFLPFADAASDALPLGRLLRLGLFQVTVGIVMTLLAGTLNRVMIVEMGMGAGLVALMLAVPMLLAPFRALVGFRSDQHRSAFGWRRVPFLWFGALLQFGGLAIMPFALLLLAKGVSGDPVAAIGGTIGASLAFLLAGGGAHTVQTAGLALATDLAPEEDRPRVVALLYLLLLAGMLAGAMLFAALLREFTPLRLIQVIQGAAVGTLALNGIALWKQEARNRERASALSSGLRFREAWTAFVAGGRTARLLAAIALGAAGFAMQDVLLEPYGGQVMGMAVGATSLLTALTAGGSIAAFGLSAWSLSRGGDAPRLAGMGALAGVFAFSAVILAAPLSSPVLLALGSAGIGFGGGLFIVGTLTAAMDLPHTEGNGMLVGAWGAVQASGAGLAVAGGGVLRDSLHALAGRGLLGPALTGPEAGYLIVYHLEIGLLFAAMIALGPLVTSAGRHPAHPPRARFGLAELPG